MIAPTEGDSNMAGDGAVISESAHGTLESSLGAPSGPDVSSMCASLFPFHTLILLLGC